MGRRTTATPPPRAAAPIAARPTLGERVGDESVRVDEEGSLRLAHRVQVCQTILRDGRRWREKKSGKAMEMWGDVGRCGEMSHLKDGLIRV